MRFNRETKWVDLKPQSSTWGWLLTGIDCRWVWMIVCLSTWPCDELATRPVCNLAIVTAHIANSHNCAGESSYTGISALNIIYLVELWHRLISHQHLLEIANLGVFLLFVLPVGDLKNMEKTHKKKQDQSEAASAEHLLKSPICQ